MYTNYYTGIGSRKTPESLKPVIKDVAQKMNAIGYTLRSGGAVGADSFFEEYAERKDIFLPWKGFNGNKSLLYTIPEEAYDMAKEFHPAWNRCSLGARKMHARNVSQILGQDLKTPTEFVVCYTTDGKHSGGTGQALRIASEMKIPIFNLYHKQDTRLLFNQIEILSYK